MVRIKRVLLLALICTALVAACDTPGAPTPIGPTAPPTTADAETAAQSFLDAWIKNDYAAMYGLLSPKSAQTSQEDFTKVYVQTDDTLRLVDSGGKSYEVLHDKTERQGATAIIHYNMTFNSKLLGQFSDNNRTMRLIITPKGWRVAWSTMDIFEGMAGDATLAREGTLSPRGTIYDRNGNVLAKDDTVNYSVRLVPGKYPSGNAQDCFNKLADFFRVSAADLTKNYGQYTAAQYGNFGFTIGHWSEEDYNAYRPELDAACKIDYQKQVTRFYTGGGLAPQVIGYVADIQQAQLGDYPQYPLGALIGQAGIERVYDKALTGTPGARLAIKTPDGIVVRVIQSQAPGPGQDVTLAIDRDVQLAVEKALSGAFGAANWAQFSTGAAAVVLDVKTGDVLAMANFPSVDPDAYLRSSSFDSPDTLNTYNRQRAIRNRATQETYALGSVFKIISMAAAADTGTFKLNQVITCNGRFPDKDMPDGYRKDWIFLDKYVEQRFHGSITLVQALTASCDVYFWEIGQTLNGIDASLLRKYANQMGVGVKTGIDTIDEAEGYVPDPDSKFKLKGEKWGLGDSLNTVIGQGDVQVTPLQVARMIAGIANGGTLYQPTLVKQVGVPGQPPTYLAPIVASSVPMNLDPEVLKGIKQGMCDVPSDKKVPGTKKQYLGTAHFVFYNWDFKQIAVCGKTGTAQTGAPQPNGWFAAYAGPIDPKTGETVPEIAIAVIVERSREGSETAGPIVRRIIESYYKMAQEPWPDFWYGAYDPMTDPNASDGGGAYSNR